MHADKQVVNGECVYDNIKCCQFNLCTKYLSMILHSVT